MNKVKKERFVSLATTLPKYPGQYLCKIRTAMELIIAGVDYVTLSDGNMDFDLDDFPEGSEVIGFKHLPK